jgi:hypothetical protein
MEPRTPEKKSLSASIVNFAEDGVITEALGRLSESKYLEMKI